MAYGQSRLYQHYAGRQHLTVAQVSGFRLADSVRVDVVLVVADDETAWQGLMQEYDIRSDEGTTSWLGEVNNPAKRTRWTGRPVCKVVASHNRRTLAFYQLKSTAEYEALLNYQLNALEQPKKKNRDRK